jgi:hypothetical protein
MSRTTSAGWSWCRDDGRLLMRWLENLFWRLAFWWKRRTGWLDLGRVITVIEVDQPGTDGDGNFDLALDPGQEWAISEVEPWASAGLIASFRQLQIGMRVRVTGNHGFDGVHTGRSMWLEVPLALVRHQPNMTAGWLECHPVTGLEILA